MRSAFKFIAVAVVVAGLGCQDQSPLTSPTQLNDETAPLQLNSVASMVAAAPGHYIVGYNGNGIPAAARDMIDQMGGSVYQEWSGIGYGVVGGIDDAEAETLAGLIGVNAVTPDRVLQWIPGGENAVGAPLEFVDPESDQRGAFFFDRFQWNMRQISADDAWLSTNQGAGALVCVLDTGVDPGHLDLNGKVDLSKSVSFVPSEPFIEDLNFHGTFVSALISSNGIGMASVAPDANLCAVKVLGLSGSGSFGDIISGIIHATNVGADVINMSLGALVDRKAPGVKGLVDALQAAVTFAKQNDVLVVASAGNDAVNFDEKPGQNLMHIPSMLNDVTSVGATAPIAQMDFDMLASYTNFGQHGLDVQAPGGDLVAGGVIEDLILSACSRFVCGADGVYVLSAGTSFSAPLVAGTGAVVEAEFAGDQDGNRLDHCITTGADRITGRGNDPQYGRGRINVVGAAACQRMSADDN